jgi:hypothetical protein
MPFVMGIHVSTNHESFIFCSTHRFPDESLVKALSPPSPYLSLLKEWRGDMNSF